jgi:MFS family permease
VINQSEVSRHPEADAARGPTLSTFTVIAFTALYMMMTVDRQIVSLTLESIKKDLVLSDTVMALIAGFGFSLFHTLLGFPAARWGDRGDRRTIIAIAVALWSGMTLVCGLVQNAIQLALARIGVGVGESSLPILHSILADSSTIATRGKVMSMFVIGSPLAALLAYPVLGWVDHHFGWRAAFIVAGVPGLLIGLVIYIVYRDHARIADRQQNKSAPPLKEVLRFVFRQPSFVLCAAGYTVSQFGILGFTTWTPAFLRRVHDLNAAEVGAWLGIVTGILGIIGGVTSAIALTRSNKFGNRWKLLLPAIATLSIAPFIIVAALNQSVTIVVLCTGCVAFMVAFKFGAVLAVNQSVVKPRMRSLASSIQGFTASIIAVGGGPLFVGALNDALMPRLGDQAIRYSLTACACFTLLGGALLMWGARYIEADIKRAST